MIRLILFLLIAIMVAFFLQQALGPTAAAAREEVVLSAQAAAGDLAVQAASPCRTSYMVAAGDTLANIAASCQVTLAALLAANPSITNPDFILPGWSLVIPTTAGIPVTGGGTHTIASGDTLFSISRRYNTSVAALLSLNTFITDPDLIFPGQVLALPTGTDPGIPVTGGYTVIAGDTLYSIARRHNTTVDRLVASNPWITDPHWIIPGWVIAIE